LSLSPGTRLGPYLVESPLGAGGMGEVYKARDTRLDRAVAIKVLSADLAGDPQFRERFDREALAISQLTHPNICTLHDVGDHEGTAYLVMELLDGETLEARLARSGPEKPGLPIGEALAIAIQVGEALAAAHHAGLVHRDLKPGNVMLIRSGAARPGSPQAKLLDFGLATARNCSTCRSTTR
jgi:serine/threonine protein kinase